MTKKCLYCNVEIPSESVIDFCEKCGIGVFGEKMLRTIVNNMEQARDNGDLCHTNDVAVEPKNRDTMDGIREF